MRAPAKETHVRAVLGANIRTLRTSKGLSQNKLAMMVSIDRSYLNKIESGKRNTSVDLLEKLADGLEVPLFALLIPPSRKDLHEYYYTDLPKAFPVED